MRRNLVRVRWGAMVVGAALAAMTPTIFSGVHATATASVTGFSFSASPMAPAGTVGAGTSVPIVVTALNGSTPVPAGTTFQLLLRDKQTQSTASGTATYQDNITPNGTLTSSPTTVTATSNGSVVVTFKLPDTLPQTIAKEDDLVASAGIIVPETDTYDYSSVTHYSFDTTTPGQIKVSARDAAGNVVQLAGSGGNQVQMPVMYFEFNAATSPGGGTAFIGATQLKSSSWTAGPAGQNPVTVDYVPSAPNSSGADTLTVQDTNTATPLVAHDQYVNNFQSSSGVTMDHIVLADPGSLAPGDTVAGVVTTLDGSTPPNPLPGAKICLQFNGSGGGTLMATSEGQSPSQPPSTACGPTASGSSIYTSDEHGNIPFVFTAASTLPDVSSGPVEDKFEAMTTPVTNAKKWDANYDYDPVVQYTCSGCAASGDIADPHSLATGSASSTAVQLQPVDAKGNAVPDTPVSLSFVPAVQVASGQTGDSSAPNSGATTSLGASDCQDAFSGAFTTVACVSSTGVLHVTYNNTGAASPSGGKDVLTMSAGGTVSLPSLTTAYHYSTASQYAVSPPPPIAPAGSNAGQPQIIMVTATDAGGNAVAGVVIDVQFKKGTSNGLLTVDDAGGAHSVSASSTTWTGYQATVNGNIDLVYTPPTSGTGTDLISITDAVVNPVMQTQDGYSAQPTASFAISGSTVSGSAIAPGGSLAPNGQATFVVKALDSSSQPIPGAQVALAFNSSSGAAVSANGIAVGATPQTFNTGETGLTVTYKAPSGTLPNGSSDTINITDPAGRGAPSVAQYTFGTASTFVFNPAPKIAADGALGPGASVPVTVTSEDGAGHVVRNAPVKLVFIPSNGGGTATAGSTTLGTSGSTVLTGSNGTATITYKAPSSLPFSGSDVLEALNGSTVTSITSYTFSLPPQGYWMVARDGGIFSFGRALFHGSTGAMTLNKPIVGMAPTPSGNGYWLVASDGGIFCFGDATFHGSAGNIKLNKPIVGMAATHDGGGYWLVATDGGIFTYGDAGWHGSAGNIALNQPIVGMAATHDGGGYWLVATDGGIFSYGNAHFHGSTGNIHLNQPIVGMAATQDDGGYWMVASDGGIFAFDDAGFYGSEGAKPLNQPIVGMASIG